jgi:hypothetical protein
MNEKMCKDYSNDLINEILNSDLKYFNFKVKIYLL